MPRLFEREIDRLGRLLVAFLVLVLLLFVIGWPSAAGATGTVRLEYLKAGQVLTTENVSSSGASVQSAATPAFGGVTGSVRIVGLAGVVIVTPAATSPTATQSNGYRIQACSDPITLPIADGQKLAIIEAADASTCASGGGGGGGAVTIADGAHNTFGAQADSAAAGDTSTTTFMGLFKRSLQRLTTIITTLGSPMQQTGGTVGLAAGTTGGINSATFEVAASDNHQNLKNGAGTWYGLDAWSKHSAALYVRFYDAGTGFNGCNSATNLIWEGQIPANSTPANGAGMIRPFGDLGRAFSTGLSVCVTGAYGNTDTTSATASVASVNVGYK